MVDRGDGLRLALEAGDRGAARRREEHLERDGPAQALVDGAVDRSHSAPAEEGLDAVTTDDRARREVAHRSEDIPRKRNVLAPGVPDARTFVRVRLARDQSGPYALSSFPKG